MRARRLRLIPFDPQPSPPELPATMASPFAGGDPHPLVLRAWAALARRLASIDLRALEAPGAGKMFGVLIARDAHGTVGWLAAFSGMLEGRWTREGFAAPLFDPAEVDAFWPAGQAELADLDRAREEALARAESARAELLPLDEELERLRELHASRRASRHARRAGGEGGPELDQESRADGAEKRRRVAAQAGLRAEIAGRLAAVEAARASIEEERAARSRALWDRLLAAYQVPNGRGEVRTLRALFPDAPPPGGTGDCAAPKLIAEALRRGLTPLALGEVWLGAPPLSGGRRAGAFYPACRGKCGLILPFMLEGLEVEEAPLFGASPARAPLAVVYEDRWLVVVDKPVGLLSVPGRHARLRDSAAARLAAEHGEIHLAHRLDLDTSGLLAAAKDADTCAKLQSLFARREVEKRYAALLDGVVARDAGVVDLPLRVDLDDRPRQIHDPIHGRPAITHFEVVTRTAAQTRVALHPRTGRTHQLRVHCAHPSGLSAPIHGDRLYGTPSRRLLLHAESLRFLHPITGAQVVLRSAAPF